MGTLIALPYADEDGYPRPPHPMAERAEEQGRKEEKEEGRRLVHGDGIHHVWARPHKVVLTSPQSSASIFPVSAPSAGERTNVPALSTDSFPHQRDLIVEHEQTGEGEADLFAPAKSSEPVPSPGLDFSPVRPGSAVQTWEKDAVRAYMLAHSQQGYKLQMAKQRTPFIGELTSFPSPYDPEVVFQLRRLNNKQVMEYRDANAKVRYIMGEGDETVTTEKDFPMGSVRVHVVKLGLESWNIQDGNTLVPVTEENILKYLMPEELDAIYTKVMEINPILSGEVARKNG